MAGSDNESQLIEQSLSGDPEAYERGAAMNPISTNWLIQYMIDQPGSKHLWGLVLNEQHFGYKVVRIDFVCRFPDPKSIDSAMRSLELYYEFSQTLPSSEPKADSDWYRLGIEDLTVASQVLQYFHFVPESQPANAEKLADLRRMARSVADWISKSPSVHDSYFVGEQLTGAKVLVTGRVFKTDTELFIVAKIIGTETSRVYGELVKGGVDADIGNLSEALAKKIAADVTAKGDTLVAKVESPEDRIAKIKKELGDKKLPVVSVKIEEQHFGQHVIDPAAQTELSLILQQCGFTVVDSVSTNKPAIEITGEALSEYGMSKGNLKSCRARIEIKARDVASGNIISVDRQTSVAVDIAEHIGAKTALQNGAAELAERLLPKLVP